MLDALRFCKGSIAAKDLVLGLTHFLIENQRVSGFNGVFALSSPIDFSITCKPKAVTLTKAIENCKDSIHLTLTAAGRLSIKSGSFKCMVDCIEEETPHVQPEGSMYEINGEEFLKGIKLVAPFIGEDAFRQWSHGILVKDQSLYATNNVCLIQYWLGVDFGEPINIPRAAVKEMIRIGEPPSGVQVGSNSITFHYPGERWLRTQLYNSTDWPNLQRILDVPSNQTPTDESLFDALESLKTFVDKMGTIIFQLGAIATHDDAEAGAVHEVTTINSPGRYNNEMLMLLKGAAKTVDWSTYPAPCLFGGDRWRGAIVGMRPLTTQTQDEVDGNQEG